MKLGRPVRTTSQPLSAPSAQATANANSAASQTGQPQYRQGTASSMPPKPIIEPIDRSNSPATISSAAPTAITPRNAATVPQLTMPSAENMPEPPAAKANTMKTSTVPDSAPDSGRPSSRRQSPGLRTGSSHGALGAAALSGATVVEGVVVIIAGRLRLTDTARRTS